ncbi:hypothetical protein MHA_1370 [Mannheimia haemolytica PHL213]|nr:hypothetical protein MHA_1370 [Mannheimia haemolytica PHL213]
MKNVFEFQASKLRKSEKSTAQDINKNKNGIFNNKT